MQNEPDACAKCDKMIYGKSICCDKCNKWYDLKCAQMEEYNFKIFDLDNSLQWICPYCVDTYCSKCDIPFKRSQNYVCCDSCNRWIHLKCSGLTLAQLDKVNVPLS